MYILNIELLCFQNRIGTAAYLDRDESLGETKGGSQEDAHNLTNVGGDQVTDELLHVVVDGTTLLNGS